MQSLIPCANKYMGRESHDLFVCAAVAVVVAAVVAYVVSEPSHQIVDNPNVLIHLL